MNRNAALPSVASAVAAAALTAAAVYLFDPQSGRRRRALMRDQIVGRSRSARDFLGKVQRDALERSRGLYAASRARIHRESADDRTIEERVRSQLGRLSSHPRAIEVECIDGCVRLTGDILADEARHVVRGVRRVSGVHEVVDDMREYTKVDARRIPSLQGGTTRQSPRRLEFLQSNWSPAPRLIAGIGGGAMLLTGLVSRSATGAALAAAGAALLVRSASNEPLSQLVGIGSQPEQGVLIQKTIHVHADLEETYARWRDLENFPQFMRHVREVRQIGTDRYHWIVDGPAGVPVQWDAEVTADIPGELIAWRTLDDAVVQTSGIVRFEPSSDGGTQVHVRMQYSPPGNTLGDRVAAMFGRSPKQQLDDDLLRFKSLLETPSGSRYEQSIRTHDRGGSEASR